MNRARIRALVCASLAAAALTGCVASQDEAAGEAAPAVTRAAGSTRLVERDVEAPEVFQATDQALWDGRPSLGGVWVASPDAVDPERVILRNPSNGKFVIGALFRRERLNPGPALQISSDAAAALGILAGQPTNLSVTALRRGEEAEDAAAPEAAPEVALDAPPQVAKPILDTAGTVETTTLAAAAIDRAEGKTPEAAGQPPATETEVPTAVAAVGITEGVVAGTVAATEPAAPEKKLPFWKRKPKAAKPDETLAAATDAETGTEIGTGSATGSGTGPGVEAGLKTASLTVPVPTAAAAAAAAPKTPPPAPKSGRAIQIGIFSVEANAARAVAALAKAGVPARTVTETSHGKTFWRVIADAAADGAATLVKVKSAGFADAYFVSG